MSASQQKKNRQVQKAAYMTERQRKEAQDAKKLKIYTTTFWIVLALCVCIVVSTVLSTPVKNVLYKNTTVLTVGEHEITAAEFNYFYIDAINNFTNEYSSYLSYMLDVSKPLDRQVYDKETGATWADSFVSSAQQDVKSYYALYDLAMSKDYKLSEDDTKSIEDEISMLELYAPLYGYENADAYLKAVYGNGCGVESYRNYKTVAAIARGYYKEYSDSLDYSDEDIRNYESKDKGEHYHDFSSVTYATYYMAYTKWTPSKDADGKELTYTDEQKDEARAKAKAAAEALAAGSYEDLDAFDKAIAAMEVNKGATTGIVCTRQEDLLSTKVTNEDILEWLLEDGRKEGDMTVIAYETGSGDTKVVNGYYVVRFGELNENKFQLKDVRHILIAPEGGKYNSSTGKTTYTDEEKAAALAKAEKLLNEWKAGDATEDSFAALVKDNSADPGSNEKGGLYEEIYPNQMVEHFNDWTYDENRKSGDTGIVESESGYHIVYFVGDNEITYRDFMIRNQLQSEELEEWMEDLVENLAYTFKTDRYVNKGLILSSST